MLISALINSALRLPQTITPVAPETDALAVQTSAPKESTSPIDGAAKPSAKTGIPLTTSTTAAIANATLPEVKTESFAKPDATTTDDGGTAQQTPPTPAATPQGVTVQTGAYNSVAGSTNTTLRGSGLNITS